MKDKKQSVAADGVQVNHVRDELLTTHPTITINVPAEANPELVARAVGVLRVDGQARATRGKSRFRGTPEADIPSHGIPDTRMPGTWLIPGTARRIAPNHRAATGIAVCLREIRASRAILALSLLLVAFAFLTACGGSSPSRPATRPPSRPTTPAATAVLQVDPEPNIDVVIDEIKLPARVNRDAPFDYSIVVRNASGGGQEAGIANVTIRARFNDTFSATDRPLGSTQFRNLQPNVAQEKALAGTAPNRPGVWTVYAEVSGFDYIDQANNRREATLIVD